MDEPILEDSYPVYKSYFYVVDGKPIRSPINGTVLDLKYKLNAEEVRRCDAVERGFFDDLLFNG